MIRNSGPVIRLVLTPRPNENTTTDNLDASPVLLLSSTRKTLQSCDFDLSEEEGMTAKVEGEVVRAAKFYLD